MQRGTLDDLVAFVAVGREQSFTKAAAKLGVRYNEVETGLDELEARLVEIVHTHGLSSA